MKFKTILITGTPGVGKTTISKRLALKLDSDYINITDLVKSENMTVGLDKERETIISDIEKISKHLKEILKTRKQNVIIDGHYAVDVVPEEQINTVIVLRRDPRELKKILKERGYPKKKIWENLAAEILDVCLLDALSTCEKYKVCEIDASKKTAEMVLEDVILILEKKKPCQIGIVDWLGKLESEGQLEEYLINI